MKGTTLRAAVKTGGNIPESLRIYDKEALSKGVTGRERKDRTDVILRQVKSVTRGDLCPRGREVTGKKCRQGFT